jgi:hypothetical protein
MAVPYTFGSATTSIPLSQLDSNFATTITLGNTAIQLGNTVTTLNNMTLGNVTISSGTSSLQTNVANATGVLLEANGGTGTTTGYYGFKNRIINGAMVISQRNGTSSITPNGGFTYTLDRWQFGADPSGKVSIQQNAGSVTPPVGFINYLGITSLSAYTSSSSDQINIEQKIEGYNIADLAWGTANAKTVTLSFQVYSSLTGSFSGALVNGGGTRSYPFSYTISSANTWTSISVTIAGDTTGTWATDNSTGINVFFNLGCGSTFLGTAGAWTGSEKHGVTGSVSMTATNGATFYITGVQLEKGSTATSFDYRPYGTEFDLCRRYFEKFNYSTTANQYITSGVGMAWSTTDVRVTVSYYTKRATPTCTFSGTVRFATSGYGANYTSANFDNPGVNTTLMYINSASGFTLGQALQAQAQADGTFITISSEL